MIWLFKKPEKPAPTSSPIPKWMAGLPDRILFVDVETTGLGQPDRVVSFAGISLAVKSILTGKMNLDYDHFIFNPETPSHPGARSVHGYSDWDLQFQEKFPERADEIGRMIDSAGLVVAHNMEFDKSFIDRELIGAQKQPISKPTFCTMKAYRTREPGKSASLSSVAYRHNLSRESSTHAALEDAWLCMMIFLRLHFPFRAEFSAIPNPGPSNYRAPPPKLNKAPNRREPQNAAPTETPHSGIQPGWHGDSSDAPDNANGIPPSGYVGMTALKLLVQGSAPEPYEVVFQRGGAKLSVSCTCPAGGMGQACKHRVALLRGDLTALAGGDDPAPLRALIAGTQVESALADCDLVDAAAVAAKPELSRRKKALARAMEG